MGEVFELEIDTLETTCHVLDPTPLANCTVRQLTEHVSAPPRVTADSAHLVPCWFSKAQAHFTQLASLPSWLAGVQWLKLPLDAAFPGADFYNSSTFL